nr:ribonuclease H-like domain-containing protein [Tanacetum cinerariifolium]
MKAANILTSSVVDVSVLPVAGVSTVGVFTVSGLFPTVSAIFTTASMVTPYSRRPRGISAKDKGKEKVVESKEPKKKKLQEQIDAQVAREMEEEIAREDQRMNEKLARDAEIARIHAEEELKMLIDGLDRSNEVIAKHLQEYEQSEAELTIGEKIELINELVKYKDHHAKILKYQAQQSKPLSKKEQREFYMSVLRSHARWKTRYFKGMTLEEIKEKFILVWKQFKDFVPMSSKEEAKRVKRKGLKLEQGSAKKMKTSEEVSEEDLKEIMQLVPMEETFGGNEATKKTKKNQLKQQYGNFKAKGSKEEEPAPKALIAIDGIGSDLGYMANEEENHALVKKEKEGLDRKLTGFKFALKDLDTLLRIQRTDKNKEGLGYNAGNSHNNIDDKGYWDSGCSRHMTGNISYLSKYEPYDGGYMSFGQGGGKITGKDFKLKVDTNVLLRTPRQHNMYSIDLNNIVPDKNLTCLVAKASADESMLWHKRL